MKLVKGRWCLVASSDASQSRLSLFDSGSGALQLITENFLPGPIMDGQLEDVEEYVHLAVTVGSRSVLRRL